MHLKERVKIFTERMKSKNIDAAVLLNKSSIRYFTDFVMNQVSETVLIIEQDGTVSFLATGEVSICWSKPAINGLPCAMAAWTEGSDNEALWLAWLSQTSVIQIASGSAGSCATT